MKQISTNDVDLNNNNQSIDVIVKTRYKQLIEKGSHEIGVDPNINPDLPPIWFDKQRFVRSQKTADKYHLRLVNYNYHLFTISDHLKSNHYLCLCLFGLPYKE